MAAARVLIVATQPVADRPAAVPEVVRRQVLGAGEVRVVAPTLTTRLKSWTSDIDAALRSANARMRAIVERIEASGQPVTRGTVGSFSFRHHGLPGGEPSSGLSTPRCACQRMNESAARRNGR
jgi:hypothetical protein